METRRWINHSLPQPLANAVLLLYLNSALTALFGGLFHPVTLLIVVGQVAAGYGIANELRWGYQLGLAMAFLPFVLRLLVFGLDGVFGTNFLNLLFEILLVALLLHPQSRQHQKIWFS